jgi:serine/threonine protein kinase
LHTGVYSDDYHLGCIVQTREAHTMLQRWHSVTEPAFPWEQAALNYLRERLPGQEPFRAWSNFEFVAADGSINEVDLLVVSLYKLYLVEIKSRPGRVTGDTGTWTWTHEGRVYTDDNPLLLANRKARKLKSLLQHQAALRNTRVPYVEPLIFLSAPGLRCDLSGAARSGVYLRQEHERQGVPDVIAVLTGTAEPTSRGDGSRPPPIDRRLSQAISRAIEQAGIRPSQRAQRVGDYRLERLLWETAAYQDWEATHVALPRIKRRVRIYPHVRQASELSRTMQRQAAEREFRLLEGINHAGILKALDLHEHERGPALLFEHDPEAQRLDFFLRDHGAHLDIEARLGLMRQIAEALQYAHERRLYHRALSPQTILVIAPENHAPVVKIFDWQMAQRDSTSEDGTRPGAEDGWHLGLFGDPHSLFYMAPEAIARIAFDAAMLDIFALGAVAYHIFSGHAPAASIEELHQKCQMGHGLRLSEVLDGATQALQDLIQCSTTPAVEERLNTVQEFLAGLERVEDELTAPEPEAVVHPIDARVNDRLDGGFVVQKRLGKGSTSVALLVQRHGKEGVLKVALDPNLNARLVEEGAVLRTLRHQHIVELYEQTEVSGHAALFMAVAGVEIKAGAYTLAQRLRHEGRLSLDLLQRFGEELLVVADWLEQNGISHRDIKPDNIGVGRTPAGKLTLVLFDFSLANTPVENIRAGTPPYLDPFLRRRKPPRWDLYAERFAVAMTLYEMATGVLPQWGDGKSDPATLDCEVTLDSALFDPAVRDGLAAFFARALHSDYRQRFDHAEEMRREWQRIFASVDRPATDTDHETTIDMEAALATATEDTPLSTLGLTPRLLDALARLGAQTVGELRQVPRIRLYRNQGLGQQTVKEIRQLADRVAQRFAVREEQSLLVPGEELDLDETLTTPPWYSVDLMARRLLPQRLEAEARRILGALLGLDQAFSSAIWPAQQEVAEQLAVPRATVHQVLHQARTRWGRQAWMTELRQEIALVLDRNGGVMTAADLAAAVLTARGSTASAPDRFRFAAAVAMAAVETEVAREGARYIMQRGAQGVFVVAMPGLAEHYTAAPTARVQYAERLGARADALAEAEPLLAPSRVLEELQAVPQVEGDPPLTPDRLLRLAVAAAQRAALSSRLEVYPQGMAAARALKLGVGALLGPRELTVQQIQQRIASRYPQAEPLPGRPALDDLLQEAGMAWVWDGAGAEGRGAYRPKYRPPEMSSQTSTLSRLSTATPPGVSLSPETEAARSLEERLTRAVSERRFLLLTVAPRHLLRAEEEIVRRFPVTRLSLETLLLQAMQTTAAVVGARWEVVLQADAAPHDSRDWRNLQTLVRRVMPAVEQALWSAERPVLLVYLGLLARYDQLALLEKLRDACTQRHDVPGFIVLIAADEQRTLPVLDGKPVPVILASEWTRIPDAWLTNAHRGQETQV